MYKPSLIENLGRYIPNPPRHAPKILPDQSFWAPNWRNNGESYPIWSTRNKLRFSFASNHFFLFMYRVLRLILNVISKGKIII